jgi:alpha-L-rhamnosidase
MVEGMLRATGLRCERQVDPLGIQNERPAFSWVPVAEVRGETQTAFRVLAATEPGLLVAGTADLWDSGTVSSAEVSGVTYGGSELRSRQRFWWSVQLSDRAGVAGPMSEPAVVELGLLRADDWNARWIGDGRAGTSPLLRKEFEVPGEIHRARAYVTGLGYYELRLNGAKVGDRVLDPAQTTHDPVPDLRGPEGDQIRIRSPRVIYTVFDVTQHLRQGVNAVGLQLAGGWYAPRRDELGPNIVHWERAWADRPRGVAQIEIELRDGRRLVVTTDESWTVAAGPIVASSHIHGEHHDARLEQSGWDEAGFPRHWEPATVLRAPAGVLSTAAMEPIRVIETLAPVANAELREGVHVVDFGQHVSGWTRIEVTAPPGGRVTLRHAGEIDESGELDDRANMFDGVHPALQTDVFVGAGGRASWEPRFTLHGFRYVEVATSPGVVLESIEARVVHSDVAAAGSFACSNDLLNRIEGNVRWTFRASLQGIPQDAAERAERVGWLGDPGWVIEDYLYQFDSVAFWAKWLDDIADVQHSDGSLPVVAPIRAAADYLGWPDWAAAYPEIVRQLYFFSGDRTIVERHFESMRRMLDWYSGLAVDGVVAAGIGDHMEPQPDGTCLGSPLRTPVALTSTAWWYRTAETVADAAELIGSPDALEIRALTDSIRASFTRAFFDPATGSYSTGSQTAMAIPLWFGLVPTEHRDRVASNLLARIVERDGSHLETGTMGTSALEQVLADIGGADVMYDIATQVDYPSWGDQIRQGATTVWEAWTHQEGPRPGDPVPGPRFTESQSMKLFAGIVKFLYKDVAGIAPAAPGWARMSVRPALTHRMTEASARLATVRGTAAISWRRTSTGLDLELTVPSTTVAEVCLPTAGVTDPVLHEGGVVLWAEGSRRDPQSGIADLVAVDDGIRFHAGGGTYAFTLTAGAPSRA